MASVTDLMAHCEKVIKENWQYVFGAKGSKISKEDIIELQEEYGKDCVYDSDFEKEGQICCDCSGLISSITKKVRNSYEYYDTALEKKPISERKNNMRGWGVWSKGHIGIYDGNDGYYAMDGSKANAVHNNLSQNSFTHIIKLCDIDYTK